LFDLDGTLLDIDMDFFLPKYFGEMGRMAAAAGVCDPQRLVAQILSSTEVMIADLDAQTSNEKVFMRHFITSLQAEEPVMRDFFEQFYQIGFPRLQPYCSPFTGVPEMMSEIFAGGTKVVIATNSVFPRQAVQTRLEWAGIGQYPYDLITCYENMHFCKPHIQYYEEIVSQIGVSPSACLMVGNDTGEDLVAGRTGMKTFLVEDRLIDRGDNTHRPDWRGSLQDLFEFIQDKIKV